MKTFRFVVAITLALSAPLGLYAEGFSAWNPLGIGEKTAPKPAAKKSTAKSSGKSDSSWMKLPSFGGGKKPTTAKTTSKAKSPSMLAKASNSTKQFFGNAKDALTPGTKKTAAARPTGYGTSGGAKTAKKKAKKDEGILPTSWWKSDEPKARPKTVPDWMAGERP